MPDVPTLASHRERDAPFYLDHAGAARCTASQVKQCFEVGAQHLTNPHRYATELLDHEKCSYAGCAAVARSEPQLAPPPPRNAAPRPVQPRRGVGRSRRRLHRRGAEPRARALQRAAGAVPMHLHGGRHRRPRPPLARLPMARGLPLHVHRRQPHVRICVVSPDASTWPAQDCVCYRLWQAQ